MDEGLIFLIREFYDVTNEWTRMRCVTKTYALFHNGRDEKDIEPRHFCRTPFHNR